MNLTPPPPPTWDEPDIEHSDNGHTPPMVESISPVITDDTPQYNWKVYNLEDARQDRPPTEWIIDGIFHTQSINIMFGAPGSLKSMLLADMCAAVVGGHDWLPGANDGFAVKQSPILWLDFDNGTLMTHERVEATANAHNLPNDAPFHYVSMPMPPFVVTDEYAVGNVIKMARGFGAKMIVIDNLGLITGDIEENSARMAHCMGYLRILAEKSDAAVVVIHHTRKGGAQGARSGDALRGHSSIEASINLALLVSREGQSNRICVKSTKVRKIVVNPIFANYWHEHKPGTKDLSKSWFDGESRQESKNPIRDAIIDTVDFHRRIVKTKLANEVRDELKDQNMGLNKIRAYIDNMLAVTGELKETKEGQYKWITLA